MPYLIIEVRNGRFFDVGTHSPTRGHEVKLAENTLREINNRPDRPFKIISLKPENSGEIIGTSLSAENANTYARIRSQYAAESYK